MVHAYGTASFRIHKTNIPGIVVLYYAILAHPGVNRLSDPPAIHPDWAQNQLLTAQAESQYNTILSVYLESHCRTMPKTNGPIPRHDYRAHKEYRDAEGLGLLLITRTLFMFAETQPERDELDLIARDTVDQATEGQMNAVAQIMRLDRNDPLAPGIVHLSIIEDVPQ